MFDLKMELFLLRSFGQLCMLFPGAHFSLADAEKVRNDFFRKARRLQAPLHGRRK
jgi:hypothetical protein